MKQKLLILTGKTLVGCVTLLVLFCACKKKKDATAAPVAGATTTTNPSYIDGEINFLHTTILGYSISTNKVMVSGIFYSPALPLPLSQTATSANIGTVSVNGTLLKRDYSNHGGVIYGDSTMQVSGPPFTFLSSVFGFSYTAAYPKLNDTLSIPATITRANGLQFTLNSITRADTVSVLIQSGATPGIAQTVPVVSGSAQFSFSPAQLLTALGTSSLGSISLNLIKQEWFTGSGKQFLMTQEERYFKTRVNVN